MNHYSCFGVYENHVAVAYVVGDCVSVLYDNLRVNVDVLSVFFFFQAEDGIRDHCVTGVQTCALPIFSPACWPLCLGFCVGTGRLKCRMTTSSPISFSPCCTTCRRVCDTRGDGFTAVEVWVAAAAPAGAG